MNKTTVRLDKDDVKVLIAHGYNVAGSIRKFIKRAALELHDKVAFYEAKQFLVKFKYVNYKPKKTKKISGGNDHGI